METCRSLQDGQVDDGVKPILGLALYSDLFFHLLTTTVTLIVAAQYNKFFFERPSKLLSRICDIKLTVHHRETPSQKATHSAILRAIAMHS